MNVNMTTGRFAIAVENVGIRNSGNVKGQKSKAKGFKRKKFFEVLRTGIGAIKNSELRMKNCGYCVWHFLIALRACNLLR